MHLLPYPGKNSIKNVGTANLGSALTLQYWSICPLTVFSEHTVWNSIASYGECWASYLVTKSCRFHLSICFSCSHEQHSFKGLQIFEEKKNFFRAILWHLSKQSCIFSIFLFCSVVKMSSPHSTCIIKFRWTLCKQQKKTKMIPICFYLWSCKCYPRNK